MKPSHLLLTIALVFCYHNISAQNRFDVVYPRSQNERNENCKACFEAFQAKPKEVQFAVKKDGNNLYFEVNDKEWFNKLFHDEGAGIAIDIVTKDHYACSIDSVLNKQIRGRLTKPLYGSRLRKGLRPHGENSFRVHVGRISDTEIKKPIEFNIMFLGNKNLCRYNLIYELEAYPWDLLDMGMYLDTLTYSTRRIQAKSKEGFILKNKTLKFKIPFEKDKSEYSQEDVKPIYDSLRLTDYYIKSININAYASVEGSLERNMELQEQRANSIVAALQTFQQPTIETTVSTSENWVEFLNDIKGTPYEGLNQLTKEQVKGKLAGGLSAQLEPVLERHRKAVLELELERKDKYKLMSEDVLLEKFHAALSAKDLEEAIVIQNSIFSKINSNAISALFLKKMEIPKQAEFAKLLNKNLSFLYNLDTRQALNVYDELLELEKLVPDNAEVKYNIVAIKIKIWRFKWQDIDDDALKNQINALKNYGIDDALISRMLVNYHITQAERYMRKRAYDKKDKSIAYINDHYKTFTLSDYDYLSLAQFYSYYANIDLSEELLKDKAKSIDVDEDLLYYYLNLTIVNKEFTQDSDYRTILLNAYNMNNERFCKLFNSVADGGVTFQLLADEYLRATYCENCND
ncbi:hypothetical protein Q4566_09905 [Tamlana sp. 2_MG-2023]|uniref:hypothetical protein n=1 Tax=unclassified Tamlana TaxID=2614803 RepID=UPI0026E3FE48|nr:MULTISPECIES: hypothetical protein [unclassified Tamlana]MDO6760511.1 hypothetical protein [Tamlana sp. 2_MG-2023]MDO6790767.1 hypothetical protein [Tamlana sp. 1_MG-2023]